MSTIPIPEAVGFFYDAATLVQGLFGGYKAPTHKSNLPSPIVWLVGTAPFQAKWTLRKPCAIIALGKALTIGSIGG